MQQLTPMMMQYVRLKEKYKDCILMFRLGDFYEMFFDDAVLASRELEITLTGRDCGLDERAPMCGVPYHAAQGYIDRLIKKGHRVAICEQLTDPALSSGLVERDVIRVITPGTVTEDSILPRGENNYIMALNFTDKGAGAAYADVSTGAFFVSGCGANDIESCLNEISRVSPNEIIYSEDAKAFFSKIEPYVREQEIFVTEYPAFTFGRETALKTLLSHFKVSNLSGFGIDENGEYIGAAGALIDYLKETQKNSLSHINAMRLYGAKRFMSLDVYTRANLELTRTLREGRVKGTLLETLDRTKTPMGSRLLKRYICEPLQDVAEINERLGAVGEIKSRRRLSDEIGRALDGVCDLERLISRISYSTLDARNCLALKNSLKKLPLLKDALKECKSALLSRLYDSLDCMEDICAMLEAAIDEDAPAGITEGGIIKTGYDARIDELKRVSCDAKQSIASLESAERQSTGIKNLRVGYNKVFGYYIEVTKSYLSLVPYRYVRKQTLSNCERFSTEELREMEEKLSGAEEKRVSLEYECFLEIRNKLSENIPRFQKAAQIVACADVIRSFGEAAFENGYNMPVMTEDGRIEIKGGRHPVVERFVKQSFVKNDASIGGENSIMIITGPNMAGKSTYMRQVALIVLMAHIGSFVPADSASVCVVDAIFTRVGASDNLASGQSTFMVEMNEVAYILNNATSKSLLILDEIGRGTSTLDGLSIAWSVVEFISENIKAKTLFATHFHELSELEGLVPGVMNYSVTVREMADAIIFLHKIVRGGADRSFGIEVAKQAGIPSGVTARAKAIMRALIEKDESILKPLRKNANANAFGRDELIELLADVNLDNITPLDSLKLLSEIKQRIRG